MTLKVEDHIDQQRWMLNHGLVNDLHKDTLYLYGTLIHKDVKAVELKIDVENKVLHYEVYVDDSLMRKLNLYKRLFGTTSIIGLWRLRRLLRKEGNLNLMGILNNFVKDYCGPKWNVKLYIKDFKRYEDGFKEAQSSPPSGGPADLSPDKK